MAPSGRGRRSGTTTASGSFPTPIPPYQRPANPLTPGAQRAFNELPRTHRLEGLKKHLHQATHSLTTVAGDVNDRYYKKLEAHRKHKARRQGKNEDDDDDAGDQTLEEMRVMVDQMTRSLEESVRKMIDGKAAVDGIEAALREISTNISSGGGVVVPTQSTLGASQFRPSKRQRDPDSDGEDSDSQEDSNQTHPLGLVKRKMTEYNSNYQNLSMRHKYASNNDYIGFKKIVHDSRNPEDDARPMPHASTWFPDASPANGTANGQSEANDDDDELEVASERISLNCPVTLLPMREPVSSRKCPHSFERAAILELISVSHVRAPGDGRSRGPGEKAMQCPVCEVMLTASDLFTDPILVRKIARIQAAGPDSDSESETPLPARGTQHHGLQVLGSDDEADGGGPRSSKKVKNERAAAVGGRKMAREVSMVPATQLEGQEEEEDGGGEEGYMPASTAETMIVDLEDEEEEEDEEEDEDE